MHMRRLCVLLLAVVHGAQSYSLSYECHLAGEAIEGTCRCIKGWKGPTCGQLDVLPSPSVEALQAFKSEQSSWGGSVIADPSASGLWHMFVAVMPPGATVDSGWVRNSTIVHATSWSPQGPFSKVSTVREAEAHNPSVSYDPTSGLYTLYYIGKPQGSSIATPAYASGIADIAMAFTKNINSTAEGWTTASFPLVPHQIYPPRWDNWLQNPEPVFLANGSVVLILNSNQHDNHLPIGKGFANRSISMATAPSLLGPYRLLESGPLFSTDTEQIGDEDPGIFRQCSERAPEDCAWHILTHQFGAGVPGQCNGHAYSKTIEGPWMWSIEHAYNLTAELQDGHTFSVVRRERPHVLSIDGVPRYLYNGVSTDEAEPGAQWTMVVELNTV